MARKVNCVKLNKEAEGLDFPPYPGALGNKIFETVSKEAWAGWLKHQTMLVNENRLSLVDPQARKYLTEQTEAYFLAMVLMKLLDTYLQSRLFKNLVS